MLPMPPTSRASDAREVLSFTGRSRSRVTTLPLVERFPILEDEARLATIGPREHDAVPP